MSQEIIEHIFTPGAPARLLLRNIRGSVRVQPQEDSAEIGMLTIKAVKHLDSGDAERTEIEIKQNEDGRVIAITHFRQAGWLAALLAASRPCKVDYIVHIPRACAIQLNCVSSTASLTGLEGDFNLKTVSGKIILENLSGAIQAGSVSGDLSAKGLTGRVFLEEVSGDIHLVKSDLISLDASSVSGRFDIETALHEGPYRFKTISGDVGLVVPADTRCSVHFQRISGRFKSELAITRQQSTTFEIQGGGPLVQLNTTSGNLYLSLPPDEQPEARQATRTPETERSVLERIASGELSAEEGLEALKN